MFTKLRINIINSILARIIDIPAIIVFIIIMGYVYIFPTIFIIYLIVGMFFLYAIYTISYHTVSNKIATNNMKITTFYVSMYETIIDTKFMTAEECNNTLKYIENSELLSFDVKMKKAYINFYIAVNNFIKDDIILEKQALTRVNLEQNFWKSLAS